MKLRESSLPALTSTSSLPTLGGWKLQIDKVYSYSGSCGDIINVRTLGAGECDVHCVLWPGDGGSNELCRGWGGSYSLQSTVCPALLLLFSVPENTRICHPMESPAGEGGRDQRCDTQAAAFLYDRVKHGKKFYFDGAHSAISLLVCIPISVSRNNLQC